MNDTREALPLVTGATGFAGSHLLERLLQSHTRVIAWSHRAQLMAGDTRITWQQVDLVDRHSVRRAVRTAQPSVIYHCAGLPHVAESWTNAARALQINALGTHHLLDAVRECVPSCTTLVVGSALVYRPAERALREDDPLGPSEPYGISKLAQETLAAHAETPVVLARPFNHIGPRQQPTFVTSSFARQIAEIEAGLAPPKLFVGNLDSRRDVTDVRDTVRAYVALADKGVHRHPYNVCSGTAHRIGDLLEHMLRLARIAITVEQDPERLRPSDIPLVLGDNSRLRAETGWRPEIPIERTLEDLLTWWRLEIASGSTRG